MTTQAGPYKMLQFSNREDWLAARRHYLTASELPSVLGHGFESPLSLYARKLGLMEDKEETEAMRCGRLLQPVVRDLYVQETHRTLVDLGEWTLLVSERYPWLAATMDYFIPECEGKPGCGGCEVKTTGFFNRGEWDAEPPVRAQIQAQAQIAVAGLAWNSIAGLIGGQKFRWADIEPDLEFQAAALEAAKEFWDRLLAKDPPPPDWSESSKAALKAMHPKETGATITLPPECAEWVTMWKAGAAQEKAGKEQKDLYANKLKAAIGDATIGMLPGVGTLKLATVSQPEKIIGAFSYRNLTLSKAK